ncbi:3' exoribonuclease family, domain 1-domain-containing protein [Chytriomyces sp. MP71]|nr:3' exoribonuclease family, domain 1-domain-containing protein [Chytriomyces sp. MP71]
MTDPLDRKRIQGPDKSVPPLPLLDDDSFPGPVPERKGLRADGRSTEEVRPLYARTGMVQQANGSAYLELGSGIKIVCAVYGPKQITAKQLSADHHTGGRITCDVRLAPFSVIKRKGYMKEPSEHTLAKDLHTALLPSLLLSHLPKSQIDIHIQILQSTLPPHPGAATNLPTPSFARAGHALLLAPCVTAASLALADAGLEMCDAVVGCAVGVYRNQSSGAAFWMVDPTDGEVETRAGPVGRWVGNAVVSVMPGLGRVSGLVVDGDVGDASMCMEVVGVAMDVCAKVHEVVVKRALLEGQR